MFSFFVRDHHPFPSQTKRRRKGGSRKIAIFSCNPSPPGANDVAARSRAEEIKSASIDVALVKLDHRMATDNYANLLTLPIVGDTDMDPAEPYSVDDIVADLTCPDHHKRRIRQLTLCIGEQRIGMGVYALQHNAAKRAQAPSPLAPDWTRTDAPLSVTLNPLRRMLARSLPQFCFVQPRR